MRISDWSSDVCSSDLIEKAVTYPNATKDAAGRLRVAAATTVGDRGFARTEALVDAEVDVVIIDTAHGTNKDVARAVARAKKLSKNGRASWRERVSQSG